VGTEWVDLGENGHITASLFGFDRSPQTGKAPAHHKNIMREEFHKSEWIRAKALSYVDSVTQPFRAEGGSFITAASELPPINEVPANLNQKKMT
jgi:hypothetical protein